MKKNSVLMIAALIVLFTSCKKDPLPEPIASFSFLVHDEYAPTLVTFTNTSQNADTYSWDFGDGVTTTNKDAVHEYLSDGYYSVVLTATNSDGKSNTVTIPVVINRKPADPPIVQFSYSGNAAYAPSLVTFNNTTQNAISYNWSFGDGTSSTEKDPKHLFDNGGTYNVILNATNSDGTTVSLTKQITVTAKPTKAKIIKVTVTYMNFIDPSTGGGWDMTSGPDPFYVIADYPSGTTYFKSNYFTDVVQADVPFSFPSNTTNLPSVDKQYTVGVSDDDGVWGFQYMGGYYFKFRDYMPTDGSLYPTTITLQSSNNNVKLQLNIGWVL